MYSYEYLLSSQIFYAYLQNKCSSRLFRAQNLNNLQAVIIELVFRDKRAMRSTHFEKCFTIFIYFLFK